MLTGRRYLLALTPEQEKFAEQTSDICRAVWNAALEQRREYRHRGAWINYEDQCRQVAEAKKDPYCAWLTGAPSHALQQTLRDLDTACRVHGTWRVRWRSKQRGVQSFRFPDSANIRVRRDSRHWGSVRLIRLGWVRFRWSRPPGGVIRNATVSRNGGRWYISFCVDDGVTEVDLSGKSPVGVDRGVVVAVATSNGWERDREFVTPGEAKRLKRLQQRLSRSVRVHGRNQKSKRRDAARAQLGRLNARVRCRRQDFAAWTANRITRDHGLIAVEDLKVANMVRSTKGTVTQPGKNVRAKAGLNRAILDKGWGGFLRTLEHKARYTGSQIVKVPPAYTSQRCSRCGHVDPKSRESQADFRCTACGYRDNADVNAAKNIRERGIELASAAGLAVAGRGDLGISRSVKRQPTRVDGRIGPIGPGSLAATGEGRSTCGFLVLVPSCGASASPRGTG